MKRQVPEYVERIRKNLSAPEKTADAEPIPVSFEDIEEHLGKLARDYAARPVTLSPAALRRFVPEAAE